MVFYFTGTGNSMWTAKMLGKALKQPICSIVSEQSEDTIRVSDDFIGLVFPTYMNDIPWIAKEFLLKLQIDAGSYCFAVMTSNNGKSGNAARSIDHALHTNGAKLSALVSRSCHATKFFHAPKQETVYTPGDCAGGAYSVRAGMILTLL